MKYFKKVVGEKCYLSPMNREDIEQYTEWLNDLDITLNLEVSQQYISIDAEKAFFDHISTAKDEQVYAIVDQQDDALIGNCGLHHIDSINRTAEFGIFIGDKTKWGKGFGEEATRLIVEYGFYILNLHNIMLRVFEFNQRAFRVYQRVGFKQFGRLRNNRYVNGRYYDTILMDALSTEYEGKYLNRQIDRMFSNE